MNGKWGFIDQTGKWVIEPQFDEIWKFGENGLAIAKIKNKFGFINRTGQWVIKPKYTHVVIYEDVFFVQEKQKWRMVDPNGKIIAKVQFDNIMEDFI